MTANINNYSNNIGSSSRSSIAMERRQLQSRRGGGHDTSNMSNHTTNNVNNIDDHGMSFPLKLHTMLEDSDKKGFSNVVSWQAGDKSFKVHNVNKFGNDIMP
jgi:hypothetical protein